MYELFKHTDMDGDTVRVLGYPGAPGVMLESRDSDRPRDPVEVRLGADQVRELRDALTARLDSRRRGATEPPSPRRRAEDDAQATARRLRALDRALSYHANEARGASTVLETAERFDQFLRGSRGTS
jgi:hypothetical protein